MADVTPDTAPRDAGEYCRLVEAYLCRTNEGQLVRIVGPSFERVCGWAAQGIPINVVYRGVDRYAERYYAKGPRRRPILIDFCEADILDVYDEWRRAVGVGTAGRDAPGGTGVSPVSGVPPPSGVSPAAPRPRHSLPAHLERVIVRLTTARAGGRLAPTVAAAVDAVVRELDLAHARSSQLRGEARACLVSRLSELDEALMAAAEQAVPNAERAAIAREAREELASFQGGMTHEAFDRAVAAGARRILRSRLHFPVVSYEDA